MQSLDQNQRGFHYRQWTEARSVLCWSKTPSFKEPLDVPAAILRISSSISPPFGRSIPLYNFLSILALDRFRKSVSSVLLCLLGRVHWNRLRNMLFGGGMEPDLACSILFSLLLRIPAMKNLECADSGTLAACWNSASCPHQDFVAEGRIEYIDR